MRARTAPLTLVSTALATVLLSACGPGSPTPSASSSGATSAAGSPSADASLDSCLVGSWTSSGDSGTATMPDGTSVTMSGGSGVVDVVSADGAIHDDYSNAQPEVGKSSSGVEYDITTTGTLDAGLAATNGTFTLDLINTGTTSQMIKRPSDDTTFGPYHPPTQETGTYQCTAGTSLEVTSNGVTVTFKPSP